MDDSRIRECVERVLAAHPGTLYGNIDQGRRIKAGDEALAALLQAALADIDAAGDAREQAHGASH